MTIENIKILAQPILPYSLHGVNPRTIMGNAAWNKMKIAKRSEANHHCQICDRYVPHVKGDWLECHEVYEIDEENLEFRLIDIVAICNTCHGYVHLGLTGLLYSQGKITEERYWEIIEHGDKLMRSQLLTKQEIDINANYVLVYKGQVYIAGE